MSNENFMNSKDRLSEIAWSSILKVEKSTVVDRNAVRYGRKFGIQSNDDEKRRESHRTSKN